MLLEKVQSTIKRCEMIKLSEKIITKYRDKFLVERHNILIEYAEKTKEQGTMYFIYDKNTKNDLIYNATICEMTPEAVANSIMELLRNDDLRSCYISNLKANIRDNSDQINILYSLIDD